MIRRPPRSTRTDTSFPTRRSSDLILRLRNVRELHLPLAPMVGKMLEGADRIAGLLRKHDGVTVTYSTLIQPVWMRFPGVLMRSEEHTSELQSLMRISYAVFCLKKKKQTIIFQTR